MSESHIKIDDLDGYVMGALEELDARRVERHVADCKVCARGLHRAARLEVAMVSIVRGAAEIPAISIASARGSRGLGRVAGVGMAGLAAAAVAVLALAVSRVGGAQQEALGHAVDTSSSDGMQRGAAWTCGDGLDGQGCGAALAARSDDAAMMR